MECWSRARYAYAPLLNFVGKKIILKVVTVRQVCSKFDCDKQTGIEALETLRGKPNLMMLKVTSHTKDQRTRVAVHEENVIIDTNNLDYCHLYGVARDFTYMKEKSAPSVETGKGNRGLSVYIQSSIRDFYFVQSEGSYQAGLKVADDLELMPSPDDEDLIRACQIQEMRSQDTRRQPGLENADEAEVLMSSQDDADLIKACEEINETENPIMICQKTIDAETGDGVSWDEDNDWILNLSGNH